jgi:acyl-CoA synthetase (AMP-forming)/AMP-acid ligase II
VFPQVTYKTRDSSTLKVQPWDGRSVGAIQVRGQFITGSYHNVPVEPDKFTADGWLRTGDVASVDEHGYIRIVDRTKDLIKSGGEWISSVDMENELMGHPSIAEAAVIAIPDEKWSERPLACVVFRPGKTATADELRAHLAHKFAKWGRSDPSAAWRRRAASRRFAQFTCKTRGSSTLSPGARASSSGEIRTESSSSAVVLMMPRAT